MKTFTIDANNQILVFSSKKEAAAASATPFDAFASQSEFAELTAEWPMQRLVGLWNSLPGVSAVAKFTSRKIATERLWKALQGLDIAPRTTEQEATVPAPETKPTESQELPIAETLQPEEAPVVAEAQQPDEVLAIIEAPQLEAPAAAEPQASAEPPTSQEVAPTAAAEPVDDAGAEVADVAPVEAAPVEQTTRAKKAPKTAPKAKAAKSDGAPREGSKTAQVVAMLRRKGGATISEIMSTMGWQKHTVRGFMAGAMKKAGYEVESFKPEGGERSYRINK